MELKLNRPFAVFDLETTGVNVANDRIVEISILKIHPDGKKETKTHRINPEMPIPLVSSMIHGIYDKDIADAPTFKELAKPLASFLQNCDLGGYNSNKFDVPVLAEEFLRANVDFDIKNRRLVDVQNIFHKMEQRTLKAAYKYYCGKDIINAHSAEADTLATYEVLLAQLDKYENTTHEDAKGVKSVPVKNDIAALHEFTTMTKNADLAGQIVYNDQGIEVFNFGKHKGKAVEEVFKIEPSYYNWMQNGDFPLYTKKIITAIKLRSFNK